MNDPPLRETVHGDGIDLFGKAAIGFVIVVGAAVDSSYDDSHLP